MKNFRHNKAGFGRCRTNHANLIVYNIEGQKRDVSFGIEGALLTSGISADVIFIPALGFKNVHLRGMLM